LLDLKYYDFAFETYLLFGSPYESAKIISLLTSRVGGEIFLAVLPKVDFKCSAALLAPEFVLNGHIYKIVHRGKAVKIEFEIRKIFFCFLHILHNFFVFVFRNSSTSFDYAKLKLCNKTKLHCPTCSQLITNYN
jgi:hypothetical protein